MGTLNGTGKAIGVLNGAQLDATRFVELAGPDWARRLAELGQQAGSGRWASRAVAQRHGIELAIQRLRRGNPPSPAERAIAALCAEAVDLALALDAAGRARFDAALAAGLSGSRTLTGLFHILRTARLQRSRGFAVHHAGFADAAAFDLLLTRGDATAEVACEVVSAEAGRGVHRGAWFRLADRVDPDLQTWLAAHPGRYLLKMTLPHGLQEAESESDPLAALHERIRTLLAGQRRSDQDEGAVMRLDPLLLAAAQADELGLMPRLRHEFGPEAHLAVTTAGNGVFVMAARAGRQDEVAAAVRRRMAEIAPRRLTGRHPGILAMFVDDIDREEWRALREQLELEGEARQFMTNKEARAVVAVSCTSRHELFGAAEPHAARDGELRFRNPAHPAAREAALAPAVLSSV